MVELDCKLVYFFFHVFYIFYPLDKDITDVMEGTSHAECVYKTFKNLPKRHLSSS